MLGSSSLGGLYTLNRTSISCRDQIKVKNAKRGISIKIMVSIKIKKDYGLYEYTKMCIGIFKNEKPWRRHGENGPDM